LCDLQKAADADLTFAQLRSESLLRNDEKIHYYKLAACAGNVTVRWKYTKCLLRGDGVPMDIAELHRLFGFAASQGDATA
jgi:TPR repeat protein